MMRFGRESQTDWPTGTLLEKLSGEAKRLLLTTGFRREFGTGERLIIEGDLSREAFLIVSGIVKVTGDTVDGQTVMLDVRIEGDLVGEVAGLDSGPRTATVTAAGLVQARVIGHRELDRLIAHHPEISRALTASVTGKLRWSTRRRINQAQNPVAIRVATTLLDLAAVYGQPAIAGSDSAKDPDDTMTINVGLTQPELAALVSASEPSVHRVLSILRRRGVLRTGYRSIIILKLSALQRLACAEDQKGCGQRRQARH